MSKFQADQESENELRKKDQRNLGEKVEEESDEEDGAEDENEEDGSYVSTLSLKFRDQSSIADGINQLISIAAERGKEYEDDLINTLIDDMLYEYEIRGNYSYKCIFDKLWDSLDTGRQERVVNKLKAYIPLSPLYTDLGQISVEPIKNLMVLNYKYALQVQAPFMDKMQEALVLILPKSIINLIDQYIKGSEKPLESEKVISLESLIATEDNYVPFIGEDFDITPSCAIL